MAEWSHLEISMAISCEYLYSSFLQVVSMLKIGSLDIVMLGSDQHTLSVYLWNHGRHSDIYFGTQRLNPRH